MTDRPPGEALIPQCETRKVGDTTYISVPGPVPVIEAAPSTTRREAVPDPRALLDAYAATVVDVGEFSRFYEDADGVQVWGMTTRGAAPKTFAALRAVLDLHPIGNPGVAAVAWCGGWRRRHRPGLAVPERPGHHRRTDLRRHALITLLAR